MDTKQSLFGSASQSNFPLSPCYQNQQRKTLHAGGNLFDDLTKKLKTAIYGSNKKPVTKKPDTKKPETKKPATKNPVTKKPVTHAKTPVKQHKKIVS